MAVIHRTTMVPGKLELLSAWLPKQPWFVSAGRRPSLVRAGGFRLDDPAGEVGIEFVFVTNVRDGDEVTYHVPLAYRGAPLAGGAAALLGVAEHGVLGQRWVYDGAQDPVVIAQLLELVCGRAQAQHQNHSATLDPSVLHRWQGKGTLTVSDPAPVPDVNPYLTAVPVAFAAEGPMPVGEQLSLEVMRVLADRRGGAVRLERPGALGYVEAGWQQTDGTVARGHVAAVRQPITAVRRAGHAAHDHQPEIR